MAGNHRYPLETGGSPSPTLRGPSSLSSLSSFLPSAPDRRQQSSEVVCDTTTTASAVLARDIIIFFSKSCGRARRVVSYMAAAAAVLMLGLVLTAHMGLLWSSPGGSPYRGPPHGAPVPSRTGEVSDPPRAAPGPTQTGGVPDAPHAAPVPTRALGAFDATADCRIVAGRTKETCGAPWTAPCFDRTRCRGGGGGASLSVYVHDQACSMSRSSDMLKYRRDGKPNGWQTSADEVRRIATSRGLLVETPEEACVVFYSVPYTGECVSKTLTWREGQNHVMLDLLDFSREKHPSLGDRAMFAEVNMRPCYFRYGYDIAVPLRSRKLFSSLQYIAPQDRKYLATFKGTVYLSGNGMAERTAVLNLNGTSPDVVVVARCHNPHGEPFSSSNKAYCESLLAEYNKQDYDDLMNATFALVPAGRSPSTFRLGEVLSAGCIPVFVHENFVKPFPEKIAWDKFSFTFPAEEHGAIIETLRSAPVEKLQTMQQMALEVGGKYFDQRMEGIVNTTLDILEDRIAFRTP